MNEQIELNNDKSKLTISLDVLGTYQASITLGRITLVSLDNDNNISKIVSGGHLSFAFKDCHLEWLPHSHMLIIGSKRYHWSGISWTQES